MAFGSGSGSSGDEELDPSTVGERRGDGVGVASPDRELEAEFEPAGVELSPAPLSSLSFPFSFSLSFIPPPRHLTAFANSLTILFVPGTFKLVPTTNTKSAPA